MKVFLYRVAQSPDGTFGRLGFGERRMLHTLEEEADDPLGHSRIPAGEYTCMRTTYHRGDYYTFEITGVEGRTRILFHKGNTEEDTAGCILLGMFTGALLVHDEETGEPRMKLAVLQSGEAFGRFMEATRHVNEFQLIISDPQYDV